MKKNLKNIGLICIICIIALSLSACTNKNDKNQSESEKQTENKTNAENIIEDTQEKNNEKSQVNVEIERGKWEDNKYTNDNLDIKLNLPNDWSKYTEQQLDDMSEIQNQALDEEQQKKIGNSMIYEVIANNLTNGSSIIVTFEPKLEIKETDYLMVVKQQLEAIEAIKYKVLEQYPTKLGEQEYQTLDVEAAELGLKQRFYIRNNGNGIIGIIITTKTDKELSEIINFFET